MSELLTQTNKQKKLFRTEEDIVANIQTQFGMPHTGNAGTEAAAYGEYPVVKAGRI